MPEWNAKCKRQTETPILKNRRWWIWDSLQILTSFLRSIYPHRNTISLLFLSQVMGTCGTLARTSQRQQSNEADSWVYWENIVDKEEDRERMLCYSKVIIQHCLLHSLWPTLHFSLQPMSKRLCHSEHLLNWGKGMLGLIWQKRPPMYTIYTHWNTHSYSTFLTQAWS